jgi:hypothetical protein
MTHKETSKPSVFMNVQNDPLASRHNRTKKEHLLLSRFSLEHDVGSSLEASLCAAPVFIEALSVFPHFLFFVCEGFVFGGRMSFSEEHAMLADVYGFVPFALAETAPRVQGVLPVGLKKQISRVLRLQRFHDDALLDSQVTVKCEGWTKSLLVQLTFPENLEEYDGPLFTSFVLSDDCACRSFYLSSGRHRCKSETVTSEAREALELVFDALSYVTSMNASFNWRDFRGDDDTGMFLFEFFPTLALSDADKQFLVALEKQSGECALEMKRLLCSVNVGDAPVEVVVTVLRSFYYWGFDSGVVEQLIPLSLVLLWKIVGRQEVQSWVIGGRESKEFASHVGAFRPSRDGVAKMRTAYQSIFSQVEQKRFDVESTYLWSSCQPDEYVDENVFFLGEEEEEASASNSVEEANVSSDETSEKGLAEGVESEAKRMRKEVLQAENTTSSIGTEGSGSPVPVLDANHETRDGLEPSPKRARPTVTVNDDACLEESGEAVVPENNSTENVAAAAAAVTEAAGDGEDHVEESGKSDQEPPTKRPCAKKPSKGKRSGSQSLQEKTKSPAQRANAVVAEAPRRETRQKGTVKRGECVIFDGKFGIVLSVADEFCDLQLDKHHELEFDGGRRGNVALGLVRKVQKQDVESRHQQFAKDWGLKPFKRNDLVVHVEDASKKYFILQNVGNHKFLACNVKSNVIESIDSMEFVKCNDDDPFLKDFDSLKKGAFVLQKNDLLVWKIESVIELSSGVVLNCVIWSGGVKVTVPLPNLEFLDLSTPKKAIAALKDKNHETKVSFVRDWCEGEESFKKMVDKVNKNRTVAVSVPLMDLESTVKAVTDEYKTSKTTKTLVGAMTRGNATESAMRYMQAHFIGEECGGDKAEFISRYGGDAKKAKWLWRCRSFGKAISDEPVVGYISGRFFKQQQFFILTFFGFGFKLSDGWEPQPPPPPPPPELGVHDQMEADPNIDHLLGEFSFMLNK